MSSLKNKCFAGPSHVLPPNNSAQSATCATERQQELKCCINVETDVQSRTEGLCLHSEVFVHAKIKAVAPSCIASSVLHLVLVGTSLAEQSGHLQMPLCGHQDQSLPTILHRLVLVGASKAEQSDHLQVPVFRRRHQGRGTILPRLVLCQPLPRRAAAPPQGALFGTPS